MNSNFIICDELSIRIDKYIFIQYTNNLIIQNYSQMKKEDQIKIDKQVASLKQKIDLINYENMQPPYILSTVSEFRKAHLSSYIKQINLTRANSFQVKQQLQNMSYIVQNFDSQIDKYADQVVEQYMNKIKRDNYEFQNINFHKLQSDKKLQSQVNSSLYWVAQWLLEIQLTQDLLSRIQLYFKIEIPNLLPKLKKQAQSCAEQDIWSNKVISSSKRFLSLALKKSSQVISSPLFTGIVSSALILTIKVLSNSTIPLQMKLNGKCFIPAALTAVIPSILDSITHAIDQAETVSNLRKWEFTFALLTDSIRKFNNCLQQSIKRCVSSQNATQFQIEKTNIQKLIHSLNKSIEMATQFSQQKFSQMRERTEAYFRDYIETKQGKWTVVTPKQHHLKAKQSLEVYQQLKQEQHSNESFNSDSKLDKKNSFDSNVTGDTFRSQ